jgi:CheY-like chemotaxis protein
MLAYAGKGRFLIEQVDLNELIRSTRSLISGSIPNHVSLTLELGLDLPCVSADSSQMQQVAMNLILNASEAIPESQKGSVTVTTELVKLTTVEIGKLEFLTGSLEPGCYVVLQVRDNGSGISDSVRDKIFEPFYTTKFTGRGLGLSAVEGILRTQKGALELRSSPELGSTFRVYFPAITGKKDERKTIDCSDPVPPRTGSILIVDDEEIVRRMLQRCLQNAGFSVRAATGGDEALQILQNSEEAPISLIVLDLSMPGLGGKQAMRQLKSLAIKIPVLICSGYSEEEVLSEFSGLDIAGFIQKPFSARELAILVSTILAGNHPIHPSLPSQIV